MTLASKEVIQGRLLRIGLSYVGMALAFLLFAGSGFIFLNVRWLAGGSIRGIVALVVLWLVSWALLAAIRRNSCRGYGILVGLAVGFAIAIGMVGVAIDPAPREWAIRTWEAVGGPPTFVLKGAVGRWEDVAMRRMILKRIAEKDWPCEAVVPVATAALRGQVPITDDREYEICSQAMGLLEKCGPKAAPATPELIAIAGQEGSGWAAAEVLAEIGPPAKAAVPVLLERLKKAPENATAYALLRIAPDEHARLAADVLAANLLLPTMQYVAWIDLQKLPPRPEIRDALAAVASQLPPFSPLVKGERQQLITSLYVHHILLKQGGIQFAEFEPIALACLNFDLYDPESKIVRMYDSPTYHAVNALEDLGSQSAPLLSRLEALEESLRSDNPLDAKRVAEVIQKIRGS